MSRKGQKKRPFWEKLKKKVTPHRFIENEIVRLERLDDESRDLWADFQGHLASERDKVLDQIKDSLLESSSFDYSGNNFSRITGSQFSQNPLSAKGSYLAPPGGRFNFGRSISYQMYFPALYLASDYKTAFAEKFHQSDDYVGRNGLNIFDLGLRETGSFLHVRTNFHLERILDLRDENVFRLFYNSISHIKIPDIIKNRVKKLRTNLSLVDSAKDLRRSIFDPNYEQWDTWIDQPSPSQWFGHYVRLAGIQGILYPSVRNMEGLNLAIFIDQFEDSDSYVELSDEVGHIDEEFRKLDNNNFNLFI
jgi:RES domain-containing protein